MNKFILALLVVSSFCFGEEMHALTKHSTPKLANLSGPLPLSAANWGLYYDPIAIPLNNQPSGALYFDFPVISSFVPGTDQGSVHYLLSNVSGSILANHYLTMTVQVVTTGTPVFNYDLEPGNTCSFPAHARFLIGKANWGAGGQYDRWWSNPVALVLQQGMFTVTVPLTPDQWSSVYGAFGNQDSTTLAGFNSALQDVVQIGVTFGGGCFFGHGVNVSNGTAQFVISAFNLVP